MHPLIASKRDEIAEICRRLGVKRLEVFGSAARGDDFDPKESDADFLVEFEEWARQPWMGEYQDLEKALSVVLGRPVDLLPLKGVRKPRLLKYINEDRILVYAG